MSRAAREARDREVALLKVSEAAARIANVALDDAESAFATLEALTSALIAASVTLPGEDFEVLLAKAQQARRGLTLQRATLAQLGNRGVTK